MKTINVGLIGFGTIGSGVVKILQKNSGLVRERTGIKLNLVKIADIDIETSRGVKVSKSMLTKDVWKVVNDPSIDIIVELVGGCRIAKKIVKEALKKGKAVVTANKALLAEYGQELFDIAKQYGGSIYYEASVAGGIPIIKTFREGLVANRIKKLLGIVNGTANYILTKMSLENVGFKEALNDAKEKGYAEANPKLDIDGIDSAHKLAILGSLVTGTWINLKQIYTEGISHITYQDISYADELGYVVKLLGIVKENHGEVEARVHPALLSKKYQLSSVNGVYNAIYLEGDNVGKFQLFGRGAGQLPTASAVVADLVDAGRDIINGVKRDIIIGHSKRSKKVKPMEKVYTKYYLRITALDKPGVLAKIAGIFGEYSIGIAQVIQKRYDRGNAVPIVIMTHSAVENNLNEALAAIDKTSVVKGKTVRIRVED